MCCAGPVLIWKSCPKPLCALPTSRLWLCHFIFQYLHQVFPMVLSETKLDVSKLLQLARIQRDDLTWAPSCQKTPPSTSPCQVCPHSIFLYGPGLQLHCFSSVFPTLKNNLLLKCRVSSSPIILTVSLLSWFHNGSFFLWCFWIVSEIYILSSSTPRCAGSWKQLLRKRIEKCGLIFIVSQLPWWILIGRHLISILPKCNYLRFQLKVVCIVMLNGA